jgi:hypothetical protein
MNSIPHDATNSNPPTGESLAWRFACGEATEYEVIAEIKAGGLTIDDLERVHRALGHGDRRQPLPRPVVRTAPRVRARRRAPRRRAARRARAPSSSDSSPAPAPPSPAVTEFADEADAIADGVAADLMRGAISVDDAAAVLRLVRECRGLASVQLPTRELERLPPYTESAALESVDQFEAAAAIETQPAPISKAGGQ